MFLSLGLSAQNRSNNDNSIETNIDRHENTNISEETDSAGNAVHKILIVKDKDTYNVTVTNDKITAMTVNGKEVPPSEFSKYQAMITKVRAQTKADMIMSKIDREKMNEDVARAERDIQQMQKELADADLDRLKEVDIDEERIQEALSEAEDALKEHQDELENLNTELEEQFRDRDEEKNLI